MMLVRSLTFMDLLSLELMKTSTNSDSPTTPGSSETKSKETKKINNEPFLKILRFRPPHVLELPDGFYLLTSCDLHVIPEEEEAAIPICSQMYCRTFVQ